jgi:F0F1-type ATP synthase assembly protein I
MRSLTIWQAAAIALEAGTAMAVMVIIGLVVGHIIDDRVGGEIPIFAIGGALIGLTAGVVSLARVARYVTTPRKG